MKKNVQSGRSMIEILAVLAIVGVLSIGGLAGYSLSSQRIQINNIMDTATKFAAKGVGGRSFRNLAAAGMEKPNGIEMALDDAGNVCLINFPSSTPKEKQMFSAFQAQATSFLVKNNGILIKSIYVHGANQHCDLVLNFGKIVK